MHIYFVNKNSHLVGPFDISNASRQRIIKIGDVVIRDTNDGVCFLLVVSDANNWNACKCIDIAQGNTEIESNTLLFSFDGINQRIGNITLIKRLRLLFNTTPVNDFLDNALEILSYNSDMWNAIVFIKMHLLFPLGYNAPTIIEQNVLDDKNNKKGIIFERYLKDDVLDLFHNLNQQTSNMRSVFEEIRNKYPREFRIAFKQFVKENPNSTIYDKF